MSIIVAAHQLDHALLDLRAGPQVCDQAGTLGNACSIAARLSNRRSVTVGVGIEDLRIQVTRRADAGSVSKPQGLQIHAAFLTVFGRHIAAYQRLIGALEFSSAYQMHIDRQLVDGLFEKHAVAVVPRQQHEPERIEVHLIGLGGEIVLRLQEVTALRDHFLAAVAKLGNRRRQFFQLGLTSAAQIVGLDEQGLDARIAGRIANRGGEIPQQGLRCALSLRLVDGALQWRTRQLLDNVPRRANHQRATLGQTRDRASQARDQQRQQPEQQQQMQRPAQRVEPTP